ncbi:alpha/beta fold hydrolase [candidate division KSB1 bacterium]
MENYYYFQNIKVFYHYKNVTDKTILFLHGLGDNSDTFRYVLEKSLFKNYSILLVDLIGFGRSDKPDNFTYELNIQAEMLQELIKRLNIDELILIGHSFGGTLGILLSELLQPKVNIFFNCEGVLTERDLTWSRSIFSKNFDEFKNTGFELFKQKVKSSAEKYPSNIVYLERLKYAVAESIYYSTKSMTELIKQKNLFDRFLNLECPKYYIMGENTHKRHNLTEKMLKKTDVQLEYISSSGHFMVLDNPEEFYAKIKKILDEL